MKLPTLPRLTEPPPNVIDTRSPLVPALIAGALVSMAIGGGLVHAFGAGPGERTTYGEEFSGTVTSLEGDRGCFRVVEEVRCGRILNDTEARVGSLVSGNAVELTRGRPYEDPFGITRGERSETAYVVHVVG